jgi:hypothetical protein
VRYFCTYFNKHYLSRGLALHQSLKRHAEEFQLFVLCLDDETYTLLERIGLEEIIPVPLDNLEYDYPELLTVKKDRSTIEYYFTCSPVFPLYVFKHYAVVDLITYLDADLYFFSSVESIFDEIAGSSIAIIEHRFHRLKKKNLRYGKFNVGLVSFRRDDQGLSCLEWWKDQCISWCYDRLEGDRFADQKYLDQWPSLFKNVVVLMNKGVNLAPWNIGNYTLRMKKNDLIVDDDRLVFFHFHGLKRLDSGYWDTGLGVYLVRCTRLIMNNIYTPYINELCKIQTELRLKYQIDTPAAGIRPPMDRGVLAKAGFYMQLAIRVLLRNYIKVT